MVGFPWVSFLIVKSSALLFAKRKLLTDSIFFFKVMTLFRRF